MIGIQIDSETGDILVGKNGVSIGDTSQQNQYLILVSHPGEWKENPLLGVGIGDYVNDNETDFIRHSIYENFRMDGIEIEKMTVNPGDIKIAAQYKNSEK